MSAPTSGVRPLIDINKLIDEARACGNDAARQLADILDSALAQPDRRIRSVFMPKRRGGDPDAARRTERNRAYADLARAEFGRVQITGGQAKKIVRKVERVISAAWEEVRKIEGEANPARDAIDRIAASGLPPLTARRLRVVLAEGVD